MISQEGKKYTALFLQRRLRATKKKLRDGASVTRFFSNLCLQHAALRDKLLKKIDFSRIRLDDHKTRFQIETELDYFFYQGQPQLETFVL